MQYALINTKNEITRQQSFIEMPPPLSPAKGSTWLQLVEIYPTCDDTQIVGEAVITVDREAGTVTKDYPAIAKPPIPASFYVEKIIELQQKALRALIEDTDTIWLDKYKEQIADLRQQLGAL